MLAESGVFFGRAPDEVGLTRRFVTIGNLNLPQCFRYRVQGLNEVFGPSRHDYAYFQDIPRATRLMQTASDVIFYRIPLGPEMIETLYEARRLGLRVWYDIDDPLFSIPAYTEYSNLPRLSDWEAQHFLDEAPGYLAAISACDAVTVSTEGLADALRRMTPRPVHVRPNVLDGETLRLAEVYRKAKATATRGEGLVVSLSSASRGRIGDLDTFLPALASVLERSETIEILFLGEFEEEIAARLDDPRVKFRKVGDFERYLSALSATDLHLVLLSDDPFNRCKSAIRYLEAGAVGVPVIATPVGDLATVPAPGAVVFARDAAELEAEILRLDRDRAALAEIGDKATRHVLEGWSAVNAARVSDPELARAWGLSG